MITYRMKILLDSNVINNNSDLIIFKVNVDVENDKLLFFALTNELNTNYNIFSIKIQEEFVTNVESFTVRKDSINAIILEKDDSPKKHSDKQKYLLGFKSGRKTYFTPIDLEKFEKELNEAWSENKFALLEDDYTNFMIVNTYNLVSLSKLAKEGKEKIDDN